MQPNHVQTLLVWAEFMTCKTQNILFIKENDLQLVLGDVHLTFGRYILVLMESLAGTGHKYATTRLKQAGEKLEQYRFDPWGEGAVACVLASPVLSVQTDGICVQQNSAYCTSSVCSETVGHIQGEKENQDPERLLGKSWLWWYSDDFVRRLSSKRFTRTPSTLCTSAHNEQEQRINGHCSLQGQFSQPTPKFNFCNFRPPDTFWLAAQPLTLCLLLSRSVSLEVHSAFALTACSMYSGSATIATSWMYRNIRNIEWTVESWQGLTSSTDLSFALVDLESKKMETWMQVWLSSPSLSTELEIMQLVLYVCVDVCMPQASVDVLKQITTPRIWQYVRTISWDLWQLSASARQNSKQMVICSV